jgi:CRISPR/Cas system-associated endonuclease/helicase Cas3
VTDEGSDSTISTPFRYHLELTPAQLKIVHTALRSLLDDFGHEQREIQKLIHELLAKLPDEHAIRAIQLDVELERERVELPKSSDDGPPPSAA